MSGSDDCEPVPVELDSGPFSMLAVAAMEGHIQTIQFAGKKYAAIRVPAPGKGVLIPAMVFCRGLLVYNNHQDLVLRNGTNKPDHINAGDWIVMVSRTEYSILRVSESESLFALMPNVPLSTPETRLSRIAQAHVKQVDPHGGTSGVCAECGDVWGEDGCPTHVWATSDRDPLATWNPDDDELEILADEHEGSHCEPGRCVGCCGCSHMCTDDPCGQVFPRGESKPTRREVANAEKVLAAPDAPDDVMSAAEEILNRAHRLGVGEE